MLVSLNHLNKIVDLKSISIDKIANALTSLGLEVDDVRSTNIEGLVVGFVEDKQPHPKSNKLSICTVNIGDKTETIVCGAKNVDKGQTVCVATVGTKMSPDFEIGVRSVVGVESRGMICSMSEVGAPELQGYDGIYNFEKKEKPGTKNPLSLLGIEADTIIEIGLTPNRSDCNGVMQIAKELSAFFGAKMKVDFNEQLNEAKAIKTNVKINTKLVNIYTMANYEVNIKQSNDHMKSVLVPYGIKLHNNVVDATNVVARATGQPVHAYDADLIGDNLEVTDAFEGKFLAVDGKEYKVKKGDITVLSNGEVAAVAGIIGAEKFGVSESTKRIALEAANFDHVAIRKTAKRLNIYNDSSTRFIKMISINRTITAQNVFAMLIENKPAVKIVSGKLVAPKVVELSVEKLNSYVGYEVDYKTVASQLSVIGVELKGDAKTIKATIDPTRIDITIDVDIIEEIVRFIGIDNIKPMAPVQTISLVDFATTESVNIEKFKNKLINMNFNEVKTYQLVDEQSSPRFGGKKSDIKLSNPLSEERAVMRTSMINSLLDTAEHNYNRSEKNITIIESSKLYVNKAVNSSVSGLVSGSKIKNAVNHDELDWSYGLLKSVLESSLSSSIGIDVEFEAKEIDGLHPKISAVVKVDGKEIGFIGKVHPTIMTDYKIQDSYVFEITNFDFKPEFKYEVISNTNPLNKDITVLVDEAVTAQSIIDTCNKNEFVLKTIIKDIYKSKDLGADKKSVTMVVELEKYNSSFKGDEVENILKDIVKKLAKDLGASHEWLQK